MTNRKLRLDIPLLFFIPPKRFETFSDELTALDSHHFIIQILQFDPTNF